MAKWLLLDGHNLAFRSFYGIPELTRTDGFPTNAIHGWIRTLWRLEDDEKPDHIAVFFDLEGDDKREALLPEYKAQRSECPEDLSKQFSFLKDIAVCLGFALIEKKGVEADDLIGIAAKRFAENGDDVCIVSADKDLAQCVGGKIFQLLPPPTANPKLGWRKLNPEGVEKKFNVKPDQIPDYLSLIGDTADNIPGIPGVGPKTASKWLNLYKNIEGIIAHSGELKPVRFQGIVYRNKDLLKKNLELTTLQYEVHLDEIKPPQSNLAGLLDILELMEMKTAYRDAQLRYES